MNQSTISPKNSPVRILVVDDHLGTATTLARAIAQSGTGLEVIPATSGSEALERVKNAAADILITDMIMPEMTGLQLIEKLQNHPAGRPTFSFLITAYDVPGLRLAASQLNITEVFTKPVNPERICKTIIQTVAKIHQAKPASRAVDLQKQFTILIADDRADNLTLLTRYLEGEGYNYVKASDGLETLEKVRSEMPDLILLDVNMPNKDGFTVLEEIRADPAVQHIPVIILTAARLDAIEIQFGLNLGADDYITKPFDRRELLARIRTKLRIKEIEDRMRQQLAALLQSTGDAILMFDSKTHLSLANPAGQKLFPDYKTHLGKSLPSGAGYDALLQLLDQARLAGTPSAGEIVWADERVFSASVTPVQGSGCIIVLRDITHFKQLEKVKGEFVTTASHDLRDPIISIAALSKLIRQAGPLNDLQLDYAQRIQNAAANMGELVENMISLAKMDLHDQSKHEELDISHLLGEIADELQPRAKEKRQLLSTGETVPGAKVQGDPLLVRLALRNLIGNAIKYTPDGGTIAVSLEEAADSVKIQIWDTGYGIPADDLPHIFKCFYRVHNNGHEQIEGNGLGLAIVQSIARRHGGDVFVESEVGKGTCFTLRLPIFVADTEHQNCIRSNP